VRETSECLTNVKTLQKKFKNTWMSLHDWFGLTSQMGKAETES